jgi:hypothetical protein
MRKSTFKKWRAAKREFETREAMKEEAAACFHEAGHAVADELLGEGVEYVECYRKQDDTPVLTRTSGLEAGGILSGFTQPKRRPFNSLDDLERESIATWAGPIAEELFTGKQAVDGGDMTKLIQYARHFKLSPDEAGALFRKTQSDACTLLNNVAVRAAVKEIANLLYTSRRISGDEVRAIVDRNGREQMLESMKAAPAKV